MVKAIKQNLDVMEEKVNEAEVHLDNSSVKKLFNSSKSLFSVSISPYFLNLVITRFTYKR